MWVTGEPWTYVSDLVQFDNSWRPDGQRDDYLHYIDHSRIWNDVREDGDTYYGIGIRSYIVEWSTDCNSDGIVDFGQILAGELADANRNNIPDGCEPDRGDPYAPQHWSEAAGGTGHWYQVVTPGRLTWTEAQARAASQGGYLACAESIGEKQYFFTQFGFHRIPAACTAENGNASTQYGPWIGGFQEPGSTEPSGGWQWLTGSSFDPTEAECCNNSGCSGVEDYLHLYWRTDVLQTWNDIPNDTGPCSSPVSYLIEWSTDCNSDGIVDFGQILAGELDDANRNNIPDCCEGAGSCNCPGDVARDGVVNGIDLAAVLNNWGTSGGAINADANGDGIVDAEDLALVLGSWGECP
jgi:hypothetical protein